MARAEKRLKSRNFIALSLPLALSFLCTVPAWSQANLDSFFDGPFEGPLPPAPPTNVDLTPVSPPPPPPSVPPLVLPPVSSGPFRPPVVVPTDVTNNFFTGGQMPPAASSALNGIQRLPERFFPRETPREDDPEGILVKWLPGTIFTRPQNNIVKLTSGEVLISIKNPATRANLVTPFGTIALDASADIIASFENGLLRIKNMDGLGMKVKIKLDQGCFANQKPIVISLAPGYEFTAGDHTLARNELKPKDGIARRFIKVLEQGQLAVAEFSPASALNNNAMLVDLRQSVSGVKERRVLSDMSKMAAVLNHQMGEHGFFQNRSDDNTRLAGTSAGQIN